MTVDDVPRLDVLLMLGDINAKVECNNNDRENVMGKQGVGDLTNNGERFINLWEENNLIIDSTLFTHGNISLLTWTSLDRRT